LSVSKPKSISRQPIPLLPHTPSEILFVTVEDRSDEVDIQVVVPI
jgi:hypothetical protein